MGAVAVDVQPGRQQDPVFDRYRAVRKRRDEKFVPACGRDGEKDPGRKDEHKKEKEGERKKKQANPGTKVHTAFRQNETDNKRGEGGGGFQ